MPNVKRKHMSKAWYLSVTFICKKNFEFGMKIICEILIQFRVLKFRQNGTIEGIFPFLKSVWILFIVWTRSINNSKFTNTYYRSICIPKKNAQTKFGYVVSFCIFLEWKIRTKALKTSVTVFPFVLYSNQCAKHCLIRLLNSFVCLLTPITFSFGTYLTTKIEISLSTKVFTIFDSEHRLGLLESCVSLFIITHQIMMMIERTTKTAMNHTTYVRLSNNNKKYDEWCKVKRWMNI